MSTLRRRPTEPEARELPGLAAPEPVTLPPRSPEAQGLGTVQVIWGPTTESLDLAGMTVGGAYQLLRLPFHIAPGVSALVNGRLVPHDHRLVTGDVLEFTRPAGEKGWR